jgi:hypothetical protein
MPGLFIRKVESNLSSAFGFLVIPPNERRYFGVLFLLTLLFHLPQITGFFLSVDDEFGVYRTDLQGWVAQGRWGVFLVYKISGILPTLPFVHNVTFCFLTSYGAFLLYKLLKQSINSLFVFTALLFTSWPTYWFILEFYGNILPTALGILFTLISLSLFFNPDKYSPFFRYFLSSFLIAFSISLYQVFVLYALVLGLIVFFFQFRESGSFPYFKFLKFVAFVFTGLLLYLLINQFFIKWFQLETTYIDSLFTFKFWKDDSIKVIRYFLNELASVYSGSRAVYGNSMLGLKALILLFVICLIFQRSTTIKQKLNSISALVVVVFLSMALNLASNGVMFYRTLIAVPLAIWFVAYFVQTTLSARFSKVYFVVLGLLLYNILSSVSAYQASTNLCINHDQNTATLLYNRISQKVPGFSRDSTYKLFVYGSLNYHNPVYPDVMSSTMQGSFFEWYNGSSGRIALFLKLMGYNNLVSGQGKAFDDFRPLVKTMKPWPNDSSIVYSKGHILIKLGN